MMMQLKFYTVPWEVFADMLRIFVRACSANPVLPFDASGITRPGWKTT